MNYPSTSTQLSAQSHKKTITPIKTTWKVLFDVFDSIFALLIIHVPGIFTNLIFGANQYNYDFSLQVFDVFSRLSRKFDFGKKYRKLALN